MSKAIEEMLEEVRIEATFSVLLSLVRRGTILPEEAMEEVSDKEGFARFLQESGYSEGYHKLDFDKLKFSEKVMSTEEALRDVEPYDWDEREEEE